MSKAMVAVYQSVQHGPQAFAHSTLYWRWYHMDFLPQPGQRLTLYTDGDPFDGRMNEVKEVYWGSDGNVSIDMLQYVLVGDSEAYRPWKTTTPWYKDVDGDLHEILLAHDWKKYRT